MWNWDWDYGGYKVRGRELNKNAQDLVQYNFYKVKIFLYAMRIYDLTASCVLQVKNPPEQDVNYLYFHL